MKKLMVMYAQYMEKTNAVIVELLSKLNEAERERDRGSYYKSLSGLARHILSAAVYFQGLFASALSPDSKAVKALKAVKVTIPEKKVDDAEWKILAESFAKVDAATLKFIRALDESEYTLKAKVPWYNGKPSSVPVFFLFNQLVMHTVHHQGQISQILDELKVQHDFSSIDVKFLPK
ncbi:MAG: DUF664 domain-containing protein [Spirochaetales bacterium]|nr:DUF664 domain-containing protein [Spirochaetales bacterium]